MNKPEKEGQRGIYKRLQKAAEVLAMTAYHYPPQSGGQGLKNATALIHRALIETYYDGFKVGVAEMGKTAKRAVRQVNR